MREVEETGRTPEEAVEKALSLLGATREAVEIEILEEGSRGVFGLGGKEARVIVRLRRDPAEQAAEIVKRIVAAMEFTAKVEAKGVQGVVEVSIHGEGLGALIGRHGQTLDALEYLAGLILSRRMGRRIPVTVDVGGYRERHKKALIDLAKRVANRAAQEGREIALEPMEARERRVIHQALQDHPRVYTYSQGEGAQRRVVIAPRQRGAPEASPKGPEEPEAQV